MAKYIPGRNYIGSSEVATDFDVTGPTTFSNTLTVGEDDTGYDVKFYGATSGRYLLWDESDDALELTDNTKIKLGDGSDFQFYHSGTNSFITNTVGDINIINHTDNGDIKFQGDDQSGGDAVYFRLDGGTGYVKFEDNRRIAVGSGNDFMIYHDGTDTKLSNVTGGLQFHQNVNDSDIVFFCDDGSGGTTAYITLDGSSTKVKFNVDVKWTDNDQAMFGNGEDLKIYHDGSDSKIAQVGTGDLYIQNSTDDKDIIFQSDDGSGGLETYFFLDGSLGRTVFPDNSRLVFGSSSDFDMRHYPSNGMFMNNMSDDFVISNYADDKDIIFKCDDGSGGVTAYITLDGSAGYTTVQKNMRFANSVEVELGTNGNLTLEHNGSNGFITEATGDLTIKNTADDKDIIFQSDDGSGGVTSYLTLDGSVGYTQAYKKIRYRDSVKAEFGDAGDLDIYHDGSNSYISQGGTGDLYITQNVDDKDIIFQCDDGSGGLATYFSLDGSDAKNRFLKPIEVGANGAGHDVKFFLNASGRYIMVDEDDNSLIFTDNASAKFGGGGDLQLMHDRTDSRIDNMVGHLKIRNYADDSDIIFESDNGSGGTTEYLRLDGGDLSVNILTQKLVIANLPTSNPGVDGQIWNNSGVLNVSSG